MGGGIINFTGVKFFLPDEGNLRSGFAVLNLFQS